MEVPGRELTVGSQVTKCGRHSTWVIKAPVARSRAFVAPRAHQSRQAGRTQLPLSWSMFARTPRISPEVLALRVQLPVSVLFKDSAKQPGDSKCLKQTER